MGVDVPPRWVSSRGPKALLRPKGKPMKLNHLDLQVSDVQESVLFFERFFDLTLTSSRTSSAMAFLTDGCGFVLVLQHAKGAISYPEGTHLGFLVDDDDTVRHVQARAREGGLDVSDVQESNRGVMMYCRAPDGYSVEVSCRRG
jgi:catechol 2,3-dioxygenase-like lactoylglutathione lyase family enzyme